MFENLALEKIVDSALSVNKKSIDLDEEILKLNLRYRQQSDGFSHIQVFNVGTISVDYDSSKADVCVKLPMYKLTPFFEGSLTLLEPTSKTKKLEQQLREFFNVGDQLICDFDNFKMLQDPKQFSSKEMYVDFFEEAIDSYIAFNKYYQKLKDKGYITGENPGLFVKINLPELMKAVYGYHDILDSMIHTLSTSGIGSQEDIKLALDKLKEQKKELKKTIKRYENLAGEKPEFVNNLSRGLNLIEKPNKRIIRSVARIMYKILSYNNIK